VELQNTSNIQNLESSMTIQPAGLSNDTVCQNEALVELPITIPNLTPLPQEDNLLTPLGSCITIKAPNASQYSECVCACACHLGGYFKTPIFLKRFVGALKFRGKCRNHTSNLWELKYWVPEWMANYNIYLLFERSACGNPSIGIRFQRKVPWGRDDTIIRFSLVGDTQGIKSILQSGMAALDDTDPNHGLTALHVNEHSKLSN
jgi:hypothetical protein